MRLSLLIGFTVATLTASIAPASAAGKWVLAWWREKGYYENCGGWCLVIHVYTFDEAGNALGGVPIYTSWGTYMGNTEGPPKGWIEITEDIDNDRDVRIGQPGVVDSDVTPVMSIAKWPQWGHYSYDCGFMYKADASSPGEFDATINCTINPRDSNDTDIPHTSSLIYYGAVCTDWLSDQFWLWPEGGVFAQSFVVPAGINRIVGVKPQCAIGGTDQLQFTAEIREGSPTGPIIYSKTSYLVFPFQNWMWLPFGISNCPVTPGQTYYWVLRRFPSGTLNAYWCNNVYASGQAYQNGVPFSSRDLFGMIIGASYDTTTTVTSPTLQAGWHLVSLPAEPVDPSPAVVFTGINIDGRLYRYATGVGYKVYTNSNPAGFGGDCQAGEGYWLYLTETEVISYEGTPLTGTQQILLPSGGWRLIGQPHTTSTVLASCTVTDLGGPGGTQPYFDAAAAGWVSRRLYYYDPAAGGYALLGQDPWSTSSALTPWLGYWLWSANMSLRLDVP